MTQARAAGVYIFVLAACVSSSAAKAQINARDANRVIQNSLNRSAVRESPRQSAVRAKLVPDQPGETAARATRYSPFLTELSSQVPASVFHAEAILKRLQVDAAAARTKKYRSGRERTRAITTAQNRVRAASLALQQMRKSPEAADKLPLTKFSGPPRAGQVGYLDLALGLPEVVSIPDERTCIALLRWRQSDDSQPVIITGLDTTGLMDGAVLDVRVPMLAVGPRQYQSVGGKRTVMHLEAVSVTELNEMWREVREEQRYQARNLADRN